MNRKLTVFANKLELFGVVLLFFSALRADGGLSFWLAPALAGMLLCLLGLGFSWLCSPQGLQFRRSLFSSPAPQPTYPVRRVLSFPKAG